MARQNKPACHNCGSKRERNLVILYGPEDGLEYVCLYCLFGGSPRNTCDVSKVKAVSDWLIVGSEWFDDYHIPVINTQKQMGKLVRTWMNS